tara:strand:+ start:212 stop:343 length:132 start_codon:yes stop_codon:yes gene_type:complete
VKKKLTASEKMNKKIRDANVEFMKEKRITHREYMAKQGKPQTE